jgi:hypothetical protein
VVQATQLVCALFPFVAPSRSFGFSLTHKHTRTNLFPLRPVDRNPELCVGVDPQVTLFKNRTDGSWAEVSVIHEPDS